MAVPLIVAGARVAAVSGRAATGAGRAAGTTAKSAGRTARSVSHMRSELQQARLQAQRFRSVSDQFQQIRQLQTDDEDEEEEGTEKPPSPIERLQAAQAQMQMISGSQASNFKKAISMARTFHSLQATSTEEAKPTQDLAKAAAKKMIPKMALFIANAIAGALELGTGGIAFLVTFFLRFITLGWYNTEMIYGGWITKGKHMLIGPLSWDPIPMPFVNKNSGENALGPMVLLIITDLFLLVIMMMPFVILGTLIALISSVV